MKIPASWLVPAALIAALAVVLVLDRCAPAPRDKIPEKVARQGDSLRATAPEFRQRQDSALREIVRDTISVVLHTDRSAAAERRAAAARRQADSLARTEAAWREAYDARTEEAGALGIALVEKDSAWRDERSARLRFQSLYAADTLRRVALESFSAGLQAAIKKLDAPCRLVGPIPCPDRRSSALLAGALGIAAGRASRK
jgi:phytoene dehydrogenase-like protein